MDPPRFVNHYSPVFKCLRFTGLATPWIQKSNSLLPRLPYLLWDTVLTLIVVYMLWCYAYSIMTIYISFQDLCGVGISTTNFVLGLLITFYFISFSERLKVVTVNMDSIAETIMKNDLGEAEEFHRLYSKNSKLINFLTVMSVRLSAVQPIIYFGSVPITGLLTGTYRTQFPVKINSPFDDKQPGVYEIIVLVMMGSVLSTIVKKCVTDCLFLSLFRIEKDFLKYLSICITAMQEDTLSFRSALIRRKLALWVRLHQEVLKNIQQLIEAYSPVIIFNYLSLICNIVCAAFLLALKDNDSFVQAITVFLYSAVVLTYLFLISDAAHQVTREAQNLGFILYSLPWYEMERSNKHLIMTVLTVSNAPIRVTAYRASAFIVNREAFAGFMTSTVSAFITLLQIKDAYET